MSSPLNPLTRSQLRRYLDSIRWVFVCEDCGAEAIVDEGMAPGGWTFAAAGGEAFCDRCSGNAPWDVLGDEEEDEFDDEQVLVWNTWDLRG